jgi:DNA-binding response OmpR family regulator
MSVCEIRILIVEDDGLVGRIFQRILSEEGYLITLVGTGRSAASYAADYDYSAAIVDMSLPDMDGADAIRLILSERPYMKILAVTGMMVETMQIIAFRSGATAVIGKPVGPAELCAAVFHMIDPSDCWLSGASVDEG